MLGFSPWAFYIAPSRTPGAPHLARFSRDVGYHGSSPLTFSQQRLFRSLSSPCLSCPLPNFSALMIAFRVLESVRQEDVKNLIWLIY
jgi:hypothetical protein